MVSLEFLNRNEIPVKKSKQCNDDKFTDARIFNSIISRVRKKDEKLLIRATNINYQYDMFKKQLLDQNVIASSIKRS